MAHISCFNSARPDLSDIISVDDFFETVKRNFPLYFSDGIYDERAENSLYIYRIVSKFKTHTGLVCCTHIQDYINNKIKKHENTLKLKEDKMLMLFNERRAQIKPILLTYPNVESIDALIASVCSNNQPDFFLEFTDETHFFWELKEQDNKDTLCRLFSENVHYSYLCDGHHRARTSELLYEENKGSAYENEFSWMLSAYFPASEITIHNFDRLITEIDIEESDFILQLSKYFEIKEVDDDFKPKKKFQIGLLLSDKTYKLQLKNEFVPAEGCSTKQALDVFLLNEYVLKDILGIKDIRTALEIKYMEGPKGVASMRKKLKEGKAKVAFNLFPLSFEELVGVSDEGDFLPPKSTFIEPRMRNGFLVYLHHK